MRLIVIVLALVSMATKAQGQLQSLDVVSSGIGSSGTVRYFNPTIIGTNSSLNYSDVRGRYLWHEDWQPAKIILKKGQKFYLEQVKLNFYSKEILYKNKKGEELVVGNGIVKSIHFLDAKDTSREVALFESYFVKNGEFFFEVLSRGKAMFFKRTISILRKGNYDPILGRAEFRFITDSDYFVSVEGEIKSMDGLSKDSLEKIIQLSTDLTDWLKKTNNKLKKESDFVTFFDYLNNR